MARKRSASPLVHSGSWGGEREGTRLIAISCVLRAFSDRPTDRPTNQKLRLRWPSTGSTAGPTPSSAPVLLSSTNPTSLSLARGVHRCRSCAPATADAWARIALSSIDKRWTFVLVATNRGTASPTFLNVRLFRRRCIRSIYGSTLSTRPTSSPVSRPPISLLSLLPFLRSFLAQFSLLSFPRLLLPLLRLRRALGLPLPPPPPPSRQLSPSLPSTSPIRLLLLHHRPLFSSRSPRLRRPLLLLPLRHLLRVRRPSSSPSLCLRRPPSSSTSSSASTFFFLVSVSSFETSPPPPSPPPPRRRRLELNGLWSQKTHPQ